MPSKSKQEQQEPREADPRTTFVRYQCSACKRTSSGYIEPTDFRARRCNAPVAHGAICGAQLTEVHRDRAGAA